MRLCDIDSIQVILQLLRIFVRDNSPFVWTMACSCVDVSVSVSVSRRTVLRIILSVTVFQKAGGSCASDRYCSASQSVLLYVVKLSLRLERPMLHFIYECSCRISTASIRAITVLNSRTLLSGVQCF